MNDIERAKDILLDTDLYCVGYSTSELRNACDLAISALEKQIPKKLETDIEQNYWNCPNCGYDFMGCFLEKDPKHCYICGQKLDWEVENE